MKRLLLALSSLAFAACGGGDSTAPQNPNAAAVGNYTLTQVNSAPLPFTYVQNSTGRAEVTSGTMALRSDLSFTETLNRRVIYTNGTVEPINAEVTNGTFAIVGSQVTFTIPANGTDAALSFTGAYSNGVATYTWSGVSYRYQKQ